MVPGPIIIRVASFFPFHATYWLNGHPFMEQELHRKRIGFCKNDNAFPATDDVAALQAHRRSSQSADNPQVTRLPDANPRAEVLKEGTRSDEPVAVLFTFAATAYNLVRMRNLIHPQSSAKASEARCGPQNLNGELRNPRHANCFIILLVQAGTVSVLKVPPLEGKRG